MRKGLQGVGLLVLLCWVVGRVRERQRRKKLYVRIAEDGGVKIGTCRHCVVNEVGRPARAWTPDGDQELDFARDELIQRLEAFGLRVEVEQEYVCP
jgi:hypothetical protein